jgi:ABC-2 type transport system ATP-binding protein
VHAIRVDRLTKRYGATVALAGVTFAAEPGRVTGFLGRNGAGKTTALRILVGLASPTSGTATIGGFAYRDIENPARHVGALVDGAGFHPGGSARGHLLVLARGIGVPASRVDEVLALTELAPASRRRVGKFSLGMRQRLALAAVLLADPEVLVLDEPANGLDPLGLRWLRDLLRSLAAAGRTVLVSSHQLNEVALVADDVVVVHAGRVAAAGPVADLTRSRVVARTPAAPELAAALVRAGLDPDRDGDTVRVADTTTAEVGTVAAAIGAALHELRVDTSSMEDVFFATTGGVRAAAEGRRREGRRQEGGGVRGGGRRARREGGGRSAA